MIIHPNNAVLCICYDIEKWINTKCKAFSKHSCNVEVEIIWQYPTQLNPGTRWSWGKDGELLLLQFLLQVYISFLLQVNYLLVARVCLVLCEDYWGYVGSDSDLFQEKLIEQMSILIFVSANYCKLINYCVRNPYETGNVILWIFIKPERAMRSVLLWK